MINAVILKQIAYILAIVFIPLIFLAICVLRKGKYKKQLIIIISVLTIIIYAVSAKSLISSASLIIDTYKILKEEKEGIGTDITFLKNYEQKMAKENYIDRFDVTQIIDIADSKSKEIFINYTDVKSNINISITNKQDEEIKNLKDMLEANYYTFNYSTDGNIIINIERYFVEEYQNEEKNNDIIIKGENQAEVIECKDEYHRNEFFKFTNKLNLSEKTDNQMIDSLKILLNYDTTSKNYVPVFTDIDDWKYIEEYTITSDHIEITLKNGTSLINKDYTLRINRYDDSLNVIDRVNSNINSWYYYEYEPVVTEMTDSKGNIVLNIKFDHSYTLDTLKNVEIVWK